MPIDVHDGATFGDEVLHDLDEFLDSSHGRSDYTKNIRGRKHEAITIVTERVFADFPELPPAQTLPQFLKMLDYLTDLDGEQKVPSRLRPKIINTLKKIEIDLRQAYQVEAYKKLFFCIYDKNKVSTVGRLMQNFRWMLQFGTDYDTTGGIPAHLSPKEWIDFIRSYVENYG